MAVSVAVVEDDAKAAAALQAYLQRFSQENNIQFTTRTHSDAVSLLDQYKPEYDIIFMDIQMPYMNGMDAAHRLRALDRKVLLVFVTSLTQYAVAGYEVEALDYIIKPVNYYDFAMKLTRALKRLPSVKQAELVVPTDAGLVRLDPRDIRYVEIQGHRITYHTVNGDYSQYGSMSKVEPQLSGLNFVRCNSCYLVNLRYVKRIKGYTAVLDEGELKISQPKKKSFLSAFMEYTETAERA